MAKKESFGRFEGKGVTWLDGIERGVVEKMAHLICIICLEKYIITSHSTGSERVERVLPYCHIGRRGWWGNSRIEFQN